MGVFIPVSEVFPDIESNLETLKNLLACLSRTDTLFWCARLNNVLSSSSEIDHVTRQQFGLSQFLSDKEIAAVNDFVKRRGSPHRVTIFFRGQILELFRWAILYSHDHSGDGTTFEDPDVRKTFAKAALIASDIWARRVFGNRFSLSGGVASARKRALGAIRKSIEATATAPDLSKTLGRGWALFSEYFPRFYPDFEGEFEASFGLSLEQYYVCLSAIITSFMNPHAKKIGTGIFDANTLGQSTPYEEILQRYLANESQTPDEMKNTLWGKGDIEFRNFDDLPPYDYRPLRERPILRVEDGRAIILDPFFYAEKASVGPLFHILKENVSGNKSNEIFAAFGKAFENYACDILRRMFPDIPSALTQRLRCNIKLCEKNRSGDEIEIDAYLNDVTEIVLFEMKAVWIREDEILSDDHESYLQHLREKYGISADGSGKRKTKGIGQLARLLKVMSTEEFLMRSNQFSRTKLIFPVLLVYDPFLHAPVYGNFLASEFKAYLEPDAELRSGELLKSRFRIVPLIIMTVEDLENLESSLEHFGLRDLLANYSVSCVDRLVSLHNYIASSGYGKKMYHNRWLAGKTLELLDKTKKAVFALPKGDAGNMSDKDLD